MCFKFQVLANCKKEELEFAKLDWSKIRFDWSKIAKIRFCKFLKQGPSLQKCLEFQSNLSTYKRETLATFWWFFGRLVCYFLWDQRGVVSCNYTSVYWSKIYNQALLQPSCCFKDQQVKVIWNFSMGSQSHKRGCLCCNKSKKRRNMWIQSLHVVMSISYYLRMLWNLICNYI